MSDLYRIWAHVGNAPTTEWKNTGFFLFHVENELQRDWGIGFGKENKEIFLYPVGSEKSHLYMIKIKLFILKLDGSFRERTDEDEKDYPIDFIGKILKLEKF